MPDYLDPKSFKDAPPILKRIDVDDYSIRVAGRLAGRIMVKPLTGGSVVWFWTVTGPGPV